MIVVVSGLPRSGTSLVMQMLAAGGMPVRFDDHRPPDAHNPRGYLEDRRVRSLQRDNGWVADAEGHAIKVVSPLLTALPAGFEYRVLFLRRDLGDVLRSQSRMLESRHEPAGPPDPAMRQHFERHLAEVTAWLARQPGFGTLELDFQETLEHPLLTAERIENFLGRPLDLSAMAACIDRNLPSSRPATTPVLPGNPRLQ